MKKSDIKAAIMATNPSRFYIINDQEFEMTDAEFEKSINDRVEMEYEQYLAKIAIEEKAAQKQALLDRLGINESEAKLLFESN